MIYQPHILYISEVFTEEWHAQPVHWFDSARGFALPAAGLFVQFGHSHLFRLSTKRRSLRRTVLTPLASFLTFGCMHIFVPAPNFSPGSFSLFLYSPLSVSGFLPTYARLRIHGNNNKTHYMAVSSKKEY
ncbi:hypothetical protein B0H11DRAFT_1993662 [Mycena galericulata]|nr:hypothetical protein B0H11DRAFT_1993662 [Mycena galericulata]